jgi:hypothetical protein
MGYKWLKSIVNLVLVSINQIRSSDSCQLSEPRRSSEPKRKSSKSKKRLRSANQSGTSVKLDMELNAITPHEVF